VEPFVSLPYLETDMKQDGGSTKVCLRFLLLLIMNSWIGKVKFGTEENCNILSTICKEIIFKII